MSGRSVQGEIRGESERVIRDRDKAAAVTAGTHETHVRLGDEKAVRDCVSRGICPVCGAGPFGSLGNHVPRIHGISAKDLRLMAGMLRSESMTSSAVREKNVRRATKGFEAVEPKIRQGAKRWRDSGGTTHLTEPGKRARAQQLDSIRLTGKGAYAHINRTPTPGGNE